MPTGRTAAIGTVVGAAVGTVLSAAIDTAHGSIGTATGAVSVRRTAWIRPGCPVDRG